MDVEEHDIHDLFGKDGEEEEEFDGYGGDEAEEVPDSRGRRAEANLELGKKDLEIDANGEVAGLEGDGKTEDVKSNRVVRRTMPKLDPERITGSRGIACLEKVFEDFTPKGKGHEFEDLDKVLRKMEHWAHRLYPKLPFEDVMQRISIVGKKMAVQSYVKKLRLGMVHASDDREINSDCDEGDDQAADTTKRYDDEERIDDDEIFERIVRESEPSAPSTLTKEQKERMLRNRQMAAERKRQRIAAGVSSSQQLLSQSDTHQETVDSVLETATPTKPAGDAVAEDADDAVSTVLSQDLDCDLKDQAVACRLSE